MSFGKPHKVIIYTLPLMLVLSIIFFGLYTKLIASLRPESSFKGIALGEHGYLYLSTQGCAGYLHYTLDEEEGLSLLLESMLNVQLGSKDTSVRVRAGAAFNSLNQLTGITARISTDENQISFSTAGAKPIVVTVDLAQVGEAGGSSKGYSISIPGPVESYRLSSGNYSIRYLQQGGMIAQVGQFTDSGILMKVRDFISAESVQLEYVPKATVEDLQKKCELDKKGPIILDRLITPLINLQNILKKYSKNGGQG